MCVCLKLPLETEPSFFCEPHQGSRNTWPRKTAIQLWSSSSPSFILFLWFQQNTNGKQETHTHTSTVVSRQQTSKPVSIRPKNYEGWFYTVHFHLHLFIFPFPPSQAGFSPLALWELSATKLRWKRAGGHRQRCRHLASILRGGQCLQNVIASAWFGEHHVYTVYSLV